ncbi:hypothetical protein [Pseudomonas sp.]|uniref:hypothetical protein n=1 Tax=Pseudomonas sp. TaxID=306 RepID=UPI002736E4D5|nr:hypothetical protein [Pseudomonas sp.]MDP3816997.1 hypothetical protein [Pseudomonas sp.]
MEQLLQIAAGVATLLVVGGLTHGFYKAFKASEPMSALAVRISPEPPKISSLVYRGLIVISWLIFAFSGLYGLLFWLPPEAAFSSAGLLALMSLGMLEEITNVAKIRHTSQGRLLIISEIWRLITPPRVIQKDIITDFSEKYRTAQTASIRQANLDLSHFATTLAERDAVLTAEAASAAVTKIKDKQEAIDQEKALAAARSEREKLQQPLEAIRKALPTIKTIDSVISGIESIVDPSVLNQQLQKLLHFAERLKQGATEDCIPTLIKAVPGMQPLDSVTFKLELEGDERDGHYEVICMRQGVKGNLADGIYFEASLNGLMAAFYVRIILPGRLAWNHGLYGRNQQFIEEQEQLIATLEDVHITSDSAKLKSLSVPAGFRISNPTNEALTLKCLAYIPTSGKFCDYEVSVFKGAASEAIETVILETGMSMFY